MKIAKTVTADSTPLSLIGFFGILRVSETNEEM